MNPSKLNNQAVFQIENKQYDESISTLTKALKTLKLVMSGDAMITNSPAECLDSESDAPGYFSFEFLSSGPSSFLRTVEKGSVCPGSVFQDPIFVSSSTHVSDLECCEKLSYVILFNLALAHHLRALLETEPRLQRLRLQKALILYEHAHQVLMNQNLEVSLLHTMAIASNLGHIHDNLGNESRARMCFEHLLSTILYLVDCGEGGKMKSLDGFFLNVMPLIAKCQSAPAA